MRKFFVILVLISISASAQNYKKIEIKINGVDDIRTLKKLGVIEENPVFGENKNTVEVFVNSRQFNKVKENNFDYNVLIDDWKAYYKSLPKLSESQRKAALRKTFEKNGVKGWDYGSMGGFLTADEVYQKLDEMHQTYPNITTQKFSIGTTIEGDSMYVIKISDNPEIDEDEPEVFYHSLIHAREPAAMMALLYYMYYLLDNYGTDPEATYLVNNREMYFLPVFNVDGYKYNESTDPNGGGMWRKNRRMNYDGSVGVDLNRNWGYQWGYDDDGSSPNPYSETYRGESPFSEPETDNVRQFCNSRHFKTGLSFHSYSDLLILPWGYIPQETPDSLLYREYASEMTQYNHYTWGISSDIIYAVNGDSDDWLYGEQTEKDKIIVMTPEVGSYADGFWPEQSRILPLAEENLFMNKYIAWAAGAFVTVENVGFSSNDLNPGAQTKLGIELKNKGLDDAENVTVSFTAITDDISINGVPITIENIPARTSVASQDSISVTIGENARVGDYQKILAKISLSSVPVLEDTISIRIGRPIAVFEDTSNVLSTFWTTSSSSSQHWEETTTTFVSEPNSYTDSKNGNYEDDISNKIILTNSIDLTGKYKPYLTFHAKWDIEENWDAARVSVSTDNGSTWTDLNGKYTIPARGIGAQQPPNAPIYDGTQTSWVEEEMDLSEFAGEQIKLRFMIESDGSVTGDGFYVDDIKVMYFDTTLVAVEDISAEPEQFALYQNYPNPFNPTTTISYSIPTVITKSETGTQSVVNVSLTVYNALGQKVATLVNKEQTPGNYTVQFDARNLPSGIYFYTLRASDFVATRKMILMK